MTSTEATSAAWARVAALQNTGRESQAADAAGAITGELYETLDATRARHLKEELAFALASRAKIDLTVNIAGTGVEIVSNPTGLSRAGESRLGSAACGSAETLTGSEYPTGSSFDEVDVLVLDIFPAELIRALARELRTRAYRSVTVGGPTWSEQIARISAEYDGQYPRGGGSERARERDLSERVASDYAA